MCVNPWLNSEVMSEHFVTDTLRKADTEFDLSLRPSKFADFVGQGKVRERLQLFVDAAKGRGRRTRPHPAVRAARAGQNHPGLHRGRSHGREHQGHLRAGDRQEAGKLAGLLTNLEKGDILFIDEIHRLPKAVEDPLLGHGGLCPRYHHRPGPQRALGAAGICPSSP